VAGSSGTKASQRRSNASRQSREAHWIQLAVVGVLALVGLIVVVGLVVAWYLPPRAHVLTVGSRDFNAAQVADRGYYLALMGNGNAVSQPAPEGIRSLVRQEVLLQAGSTLVDGVTDQDVRDEIATLLSLPEDYTDEAYASGLASYLRVAPIDRSGLEDLTRAGIIEDRLAAQFRDDLPEAGDQMNVLAVQTNDRALAQQLVDAVRGGQDFREAALEVGVVEDDESIFELGWTTVETLAERVQPALEPLQAGDVSDPVDDANSVGYEVYYVAERTVDQPYEDEVRDRLADRALADFLEDQEAAIGVEEDLSASKRRWITQRVQDDIRERQASSG